MKKTILYAILALTLVATLQPTKINAASWQYAVCTHLLAANDIGIGLIATPVKTVASNVEHIDASALSKDICSYADGSLGEFHNTGIFESIANDIKGFFQSIFGNIIKMFCRIL